MKVHTNALHMKKKTLMEGRDKSEMVLKCVVVLVEITEVVLVVGNEGVNNEYSVAMVLSIWRSWFER